MFDLRLQDIAAWIRNGKYSSVALQLPEGLKLKSMEIIDALSKDCKCEFIIIGDPCYGACDLCVDYKQFADALIHFGHSPIPSQGDDKNVFYVEVFSNVDIREHIKKILPTLPDKIGLVSTIQYIGCLDQAKEIIEKAGKNAIIGIGDKRIAYPGQILGCNTSSAENIADKVDEFLFIGEGDFHPLAVAFSIKKRMRIMNPITGEMRSVDEEKEKMLRKRFASIEKAKNANSFLVIVSSKVGQNRDKDADKIVQMINSEGKKAYKARMNELSSDNLAHYKVDVLVSTACPRLAIDDSSRYGKPILTVTEAEIALGKRDWENYTFDSIRP